MSIKVEIPDWFINGLQFKSEFINDGANICEVKSFDANDNTIAVHVRCTNNEVEFMNDDWNLQHVIWAFENGDYKKL